MSNHTQDVEQVRTEEDLVEVLSDLVGCGEFVDDPDLSLRTFDDAGVLTRNAGVVLRFGNGAEFQVTIVQSQEATR